MASVSYVNSTISPLFASFAFVFRLSLAFFIIRMLLKGEPWARVLFSSLFVLELFGLASGIFELFDVLSNFSISDINPSNSTALILILVQIGLALTEPIFKAGAFFLLYQEDSNMWFKSHKRTITISKTITIFFLIAAFGLLVFALDNQFEKHFPWLIFSIIFLLAWSQSFKFYKL
jgi:hypothetical protein